MSRTAGLLRELFPGTERSVYLDVAAVGLVSTRVADAVREFTTGHLLHGVGDNPRRDMEKTLTRQAIADLVGGRAEHVAFTQNTSTGLAIVANGIDWSPGDSLVVPAGEFPSNFYPWTRLRLRGVEIREVEMHAGHAPPAAVADAVDATTRVLAVSSVQYSSGHRNDLGAMGEIARRSGALLVVDGTQSVGALTLDADALQIDLLAVSAHKWMLGPLGIGFAHLSERAMDELHPSTVGWLSVDAPFDFDHEPRLAEDGRRFESGTENMAGIAGLRQAIGQVLELGRDAVERQILDLTEEIGEMLAGLGWSSLRDRDRRHWSGLLFATSGADDRAAHARLLDAGVRCSLRGGGVRFSPHYFTSSDDVDRVRSVLADGARRGRVTD